MNAPARPADPPPWTLTVAEASARVARGELSPPALLESVLARIEATDDRVHAYIRVAAAQAREAACSTATA